MKVKLQKIISGVACMAFTLSAMTVPDNLIANAVNLESPVIVNATATGDETKRTENGLYYEIYEDDWSENPGNYVVITGYDESAGSEVIIPEMIEGLPVTSIRDIAFYNCSSLTSVIIPDGVTSIGWDTFSGCSSLTSVTIPDSVTSIDIGAFRDCSSLTSVTIPNHVISIKNFAFQGCSSLESVTIPESVKDIGNGAFSDCSSLTAIHVDPENKNYMDSNGVLFSKNQESLYQYPAGKPDQSYSIPDGVTYIGYSAFESCSSLTSVIIPDSVRHIDYAAFANCTSLETVTIPDSVIYIEYKAFSDCSSLTSIHVDPENQEYMDIDGVLFSKDQETLMQYPAGKPDQSYSIPDGVTNIGYSAFEGCSFLTSVAIPDSVTRIESDVFINCSSLTSVTIPDSVTSIGNSVFSGCSSLTAIHVDTENREYMDIDGVLFSKDQRRLDQYPAGKPDQSYSIPDSVTVIGWNAFQDCSSLESVTIPDSVTSIEGSTFSGCSSLASVTIPDSVTSIGYGAFSDCSSLVSVTIQNPDCEIGDYKYTLSDTTTIYGYPDSTAQAYAERYNREFVALDENPVNSEILWGDANDDGAVDISDVVLMNRVYVGVDQVTTQGLTNADVDQSGKIELSDSMNVLKLLVHLLEQSDFPIGQ